MSPSRRWTWTRLVLEAEAAIDFSPRSDSGSQAAAVAAAFLLQQTDEAREVHSQEWTSADRWSNLTSSAPDRSPGCDAELSL